VVPPLYGRATCEHDSRSLFDGARGYRARAGPATSRWAGGGPGQCPLCRPPPFEDPGVT
jgi:hypothetical protein